MPPTSSLVLLPELSANESCGRGWEGPQVLATLLPTSLKLCPSLCTQVQSGSPLLECSRVPFTPPTHTHPPTHPHTHTHTHTHTPLQATSHNGSLPLLPWVLHKHHRSLPCSHHCNCPFVNPPCESPWFPQNPRYPFLCSRTQDKFSGIPMDCRYSWSPPEMPTLPAHQEKGL